MRPRSPVRSAYCERRQAVGQSVQFSAVVEVPPGAGTVVAAQWDFEGTADFPVAQQMGDTKSARVILVNSHTFAKPGTYLPVVRVASQREGNTASPFARPLNLDRVRVVVK